jgi:hypothetical protein
MSNVAPILLALAAVHLTLLLRPLTSNICSCLMEWYFFNSRLYAEGTTNKVYKFHAPV